jgi:hypothetical protein
LQDSIFEEPLQLALSEMLLVAHLYRSNGEGICFALKLKHAH